MAQDEIVTNIPTEMALRQAEIQATRTLTESVNRLTGRMDHFAEDLGEIKSKVTVIEARNFDSQIAKLEEANDKAVQILHDSNKARDTRINTLEQLVAKYGAYMAVMGSIGGAALGLLSALMVAVAVKVFVGR